MTAYGQLESNSEQTSVRDRLHEQLNVAPTRDSAVRDAAWYRILRRTLWVGDALVVLGAVSVSYFIRVHAGAEPRESAHPLEDAVVISLAWICLLALSGSRDRAVLGAGFSEYGRVIAASFASFGLIAIGSYLLKADVSRFYFVAALPLGLVSLSAFRVIARCLLQRQWQRGRLVEPAIVVGSSSFVKTAVDQLRSRSKFGLSPKAICPVDEGTTESDLPIVPYRKLAEAVAGGEFDSVVIVDGVSSGAVREMSWRFEPIRVRVILMPDLVAATGPRLNVQNVVGVNLIHLEVPRFAGWTQRVKRIFDIVFSASMLILLSPILLLIGIAIYVDDPGPVIFRQQRIGLRGERFTIHKFRSMKVGSEAKFDSLREHLDESGPLFKMGADPRVTRVGRFLRNHSLDELPQFWTVLRGDMSVVGPRPHLEKELDSFPDRALGRLLIKPGITGLWQVSGRSDLSFEASAELDLRYVQNWTLLGDLLIIAKTVKTMVTSEGAY